MTRVLLVSTYELGHQPLHVASPAAALRAAGHEVRCIDVSVERWDPALVDWAERVAFSVPMHTAMRLAMRAAAAVKRRRPELPVCFYGLYAPVSRDLTLGRLADRVIAGEYEPALVAWAGGAQGGGRRGDVQRLVAELVGRDEEYAHGYDASAPAAISTSRCSCALRSACSTSSGVSAFANMKPR